MKWTLYLAGEIHSDWRSEIENGVNREKLPVVLTAPVTDHEASDNVGTDILGKEPNSFWKDRKGAGINAIRTRSLIENSDIVIVKFGENYRQWNAAFDAGYASALGKKLIIIHPEEFDHALKEVDQAANAVARTEGEAVEILKYVITKR
jgi:YtoQ family protein